MLLDEIKKEWLFRGSRAIREIILEHPSESFYAAAFHLFYSDYRQILAPALAINAESFIEIHNDQGSTWTTRWAPPEWNWPVLDDACNAMKPVYSKLSEAMVDAKESDWDDLIRLHDQVMADVSKKLTIEIHDNQSESPGLNLPNDFVVVVLDGQRDSEEYNALVQASVEPGRLAQLDGVLFQ